MSEDVCIYQRINSIYSKNVYSIHMSKKNHHMYTVPVPDLRELNEIYSNDYSFAAHKVIDFEKGIRAHYLFGKIRRFLFEGNRVLELGPMYGHYLAILKRHGFTVKGAELSSIGVKECKQKGLDVINSSAEQFLAEVTEKYDMVHLSHSLEHFLRPEEVLQGIYQVLNQGGKLTILVPNNQSKLIRLFGKAWGYWAVPVHLNHFSEVSLRSLLAKSGFKTVFCATQGGDSLMWLGSILNLVGVKLSSNDRIAKVGFAKKLILLLASFLFLPWLYFGNDDLVLVAEKVSK